MPLRRGRNGGGTTPSSGCGCARSFMVWTLCARWAAARTGAFYPPAAGAASQAPAAQVSSVPTLVDQLVGLDPRHHRAQLLANHLDLMLGGESTARQQR